MYPMHMPGHKRQTGSQWPGHFPNPFSVDITEIDGFDNLHHPEGILKKSLEWAAGVYGADRSYYLVNGSSGGILAAISAAVRPGGTILISRNCHKAVYHGVILNQLRAEYVYPQIIDDLGIQGGINACDVEKVLKEQPEIQAVLIVSPTYDGVVSDIEAIAKVVHKAKLPLIVDEAHGAHFPFGGAAFPVSALDLGADLVIQSLHKTLPSLTQTAILHAKCGLVNLERLERYLQMYQTSSPSYVLMAGIESCIYEMEQHGAELMEQFAERLLAIREPLQKMRHLKLLDSEYVGVHGVFDVDRSKLVISCRGCVCDAGEKQIAVTGEILAGWLREKYHLEMEMCGADYVVAIATAWDSVEGLLRLRDALLELDEELGASGTQKVRSNSQEEKACAVQEIRPVVRMKMGDAMEADVEQVLLEKSVGLVSAEFIYLYPPGIPIVAPGELMTEQILEQVLYDQRIGLPVQGLADSSGRRIKVVVE